MIKNKYILPQEFSFKRVSSFVKKILAGNFALALIALPGAQTQATPIMTQSQALLIPQTNLDTAFNITPKNEEPKIQIPTNFIYMSQGFSSFHPAIDLATHYGNPVKPIMSGIVEFAGFSPFGYGNEVLIDNGNGIESLYAHLSKIEVKINDSINTNTEIGLVGTTGHATGPHLHLEVHKNGQPINPVSFLPPLKSAQTLTFDDSDEKEVTPIKTTNNLLTKLVTTKTELTSIPQ